ncbi:hypothetical protein F7Q90_15140 [Pantoea stewartii subsp. stewartii]|nr:hypothetical protein F7Q90_15140 [Pantoea stewartii subsp. stewartii]
MTGKRIDDGTESNTRYRRRHLAGSGAFRNELALLNKWILCCGTMKTVVSDNIKSMRYMLAYDGVLSGISVFYQNSADKTE